MQNIKLKKGVRKLRLEALIKASGFIKEMIQEKAWRLSNFFVI